MHNSLQAISQMRKYATPVDAHPVEKEYAFEVSASEVLESEVLSLETCRSPLRT